MNLMELIGLTAGASFASGINLYATVAVLGLLQRYHFVTLPVSLQVLGNPIVLGVAIALYVVEFVADKIPYFDSLWDTVHTFIRPPAAGLLAYAAFGGVPEEWRLVAGLVGGSIAFTSHGAKTSTRAAANVSPEPISNWILSFSEDVLAVGIVWMATRYPILTLGIVIALTALAIYLLTRFFKFMRRAFSRIRTWRPSRAI